MCPSSYQQAMKTDEEDLWKEAMERELRSIEENDTYELSERPRGPKVLRNP